MRVLLRPQGCLRYGTTLRAWLPPACNDNPVQTFDHGGHTAASTVVTLHEAGSLTLHMNSQQIFSVDGSHTVDTYSTMDLTNVGASADVALQEGPGVVGFLCHIVDVVVPRQSSVYGYSKVLGAFNLL